MKLTYDKSKVTWDFEGKKYEYSVDNDNISSAYLKNGYIYISSNNTEYTQFTNIYITYAGKLIVSASYMLKGYLNFITILDEKNKKTYIEIKQLQNLGATANYIYVIAGKNTDAKLIKYSLHGKKTQEYNPPIGCTFERFFSSIDNDKEIEVICNGQEDENGHWQWCFALNTETGEWEKRQSIDGH